MFKVDGRESAPTYNNNIGPLTRPRQIRHVNFDMDSPRMKLAMDELGLDKEDLNTRKRKDDFLREFRAEMESKQ